MSLDFELQKYPKESPLKDGTTCTLRPCAKRTRKPSMSFFAACRRRSACSSNTGDGPPGNQGLVPQHRFRTQPAPAALIAGKLAGVATLHQQLGGWKRHVGRVSVLVLPQFRGRGLARALVSEIVTVAHGGQPGKGRSRVYWGAGSGDQNVRVAGLQQSPAVEGLRQRQCRRSRMITC